MTTLPRTGRPPADADLPMPASDDVVWREIAASPRRPLTTRQVLLALGGVVALVAVFIGHRTVLSTLIHDQRQRHLASEFQTASPSIGSGEALAIVQIASLGVNEMVVEGSSVANLRSGPTHRSGSRLPGESGTMVIDGHRTMYGAPFRQIEKLQKGDAIAVQARNGPVVPYVTIEVLRGDDTEVVARDVPAGTARLVLVTAPDGFGSANRIMVIAETPAVLKGDGDGLVGPLPNGSPIGLETLLAVLGLTCAAPLFRFLRQTLSTATALALVSPVLFTGLVGFLLALDRVLPHLR